MVIYFSGTGNSKYCAEIIASKLGDECIDSFHYIKNQIAGEFISGKPWVFVAPTYCWSLPHVFEDFIKTANFDGVDEAYFVMTCGGEIGNAAAQIKELCDLKGLIFKGVLEVVMPENYIVMFDAPEAEEAARIVKVGVGTVERSIKYIAEGKDFPEVKVGLIDRIKSGPTNPVFYKIFVKDKAFYTTDACIGCGKCVELCVLNNISLEKGKPVWHGNCTHCMACICKCPQEAIEYGKHSRGKVRYRLEG